MPQLYHSVRLLYHKWLPQLPVLTAVHSSETCPGRRLELREAFGLWSNGLSTLSLDKIKGSPVTGHGFR